MRDYLEEKSSDSGLENREYGLRYPSRWPRGILYPQKLVLTSPASGDRSVGIVRSQTHSLSLIHKREGILVIQRTRIATGYTASLPSAKVPQTALTEMLESESSRLRPF
jgi:hypothetical protein